MLSRHMSYLENTARQSRSERSKGPEMADRTLENAVNNCSTCSNATENVYAPSVTGGWTRERTAGHPRIKHGSGMCHY
jgi:hypothetical protein